MAIDSDQPGVHLTPTAEATEPVAALAARLSAGGGGRVSLTALVSSMERRARRVPLPLPTISRAWAWDAVDCRDPRWWPQGVTTSADAADQVAGTDLVVVAWYAKALPGDPSGGHGVRLSFFDHARRRYEHVLVVVPRAVGDAGGPGGTDPLRAHAGGLVWAGEWLHIAATARGFVSCRLSDLMRVPEGERAEHVGYRYLLPVSQRHRAGAEEGVERLRYSFFCLDRDAEPPALLVGEYGRRGQTRRFARFDLDPDTLLPALDEDGRARPRLAEGVGQMQGVAIAAGTQLVTSSRGPWRPGSVWTGEPGSMCERRWATPMGPEDLAYDAATGWVWSATEHPRRRWICALDADRLAGRGRARRSRPTATGS